MNSPTTDPAAAHAGEQAARLLYRLTKLAETAVGEAADALNVADLGDRTTDYLEAIMRAQAALGDAKREALSQLTPLERAGQFWR